MTRAEYVEQHGCEPHDVGYWGPGGVQVAARWGDLFHLRRGADYHVNGVDHGGPGQVRKDQYERRAVTRAEATGNYDQRTTSRMGAPASTPRDERTWAPAARHAAHLARVLRQSGATVRDSERSRHRRWPGARTSVDRRSAARGGKEPAMRQLAAYPIVLNRRQLTCAVSSAIR